MSYAVLVASRSKWLFAITLAFAVAATGCGDDDDDSGSGGSSTTGGTSGSGGSGGTHATGGASGSSGVPSVTVAAQTLSQVSTRVTVTSAVSNGAGFVVIHEQTSGNPGAVLGSTLLTTGTNANVDVTLSRPIANTETLYAMLHSDANTNGTFDGEVTDPPVHDSSNAVIAPTFQATVDPGTPAVILKVNNVSTTAWKWVSTTPSSFASSIIGAGSNNQTVTLKHDWRYELDLSSVDTATHPFEFTNNANSVQLSQNSSGAIESTMSVGWTESSAIVRFTTSTDFRSAVTKYRCGNHAAMTGSVAFTP